jgi:hypothetical protein
LAALPILLSGLCLAAQNGKPRCSAKLHGRFWPEQANSDAKLAVALARSGELEICSVRVWKYRWESLTVHISQLAKDGGQNVTKDRAAVPRTD